MRRVLLPLLLVTLAACVTTPEQEVDAAQAADNAAERAAQALRRGDEALASNQYGEAVRNYDFVRVTFPYLAAATQAELRLADVDFASEMWVAARERYDNFVKLHPTSSKVDYAAFRSALSWYRQIPNDFFLLPSSITKDQTATQGARRALTRFIKDYPESEFLPEAKKALEETEDKLARHELLVAEFYRKGDRWKAVALRLEWLLEQYPDSKRRPEALLGLSEAYAKLERPEDARGALERLVKSDPESPEAKQARTRLEKAPAATPEAPAAKPETQTPTPAPATQD